MKIDSKMTDAALLGALGARLAGWRLARNLTQQELAEEAGLGLRTVQRLESGVAATQLSGFLRVCRVLGLVERLDALIPEAAAGPMEQLALRGGRRQRASGRRAVPAPPEPWTWDEPAPVPAPTEGGEAAGGPGSGPGSGSGPGTGRGPERRQTARRASSRTPGSGPGAGRGPKPRGGAG